MQIWHLRNIYLERSKINLLTFAHNNHEIRFSIDRLYCECVKPDIKMQKHLDVNGNCVDHVKMVDRYPDVGHTMAKLKNVVFYKNKGFLFLIYPFLSDLTDKVYELRLSKIFLISKCIQIEKYKWSKRKKQAKRVLVPALLLLFAYLFTYWFTCLFTYFWPGQITPILWVPVYPFVSNN